MNSTNLIYMFMVFWGMASIYQIISLAGKKDISKHNQYIYSSIPGVFTTLGVLGTFIGIFIGLKSFDTTNITESIPPLLEGLKTAFLTSIVGIICSVIFGRTSEIVLKFAENNQPPKSTEEVDELYKIAQILEANQEQANDHSNKMITHLAGLNQKQDTQNSTMQQVLNSIEGEQEASLKSQVQILRSEQAEYNRDAERHIRDIVETMNNNNRLIQQKFEEFSDLLAKSNTEVLVEVMKRATEEFNAQMKDLIDKLVQENFAELNRSVERMNQWQQENKTMITQLTEQFTAVSGDIGTASKSIKEITANTSKLTDDNSQLKKLIEALQKVMIDDTKYQEIVDQLTTTIDTLHQNTQAFDQTTNKLNKWVRNQMNFNDSVGKLLTRLEDIERIKDINEDFWNNTKKQMNEGVTIIANASNKLNQDIDSLNEMFYEQLNHTLTSLDGLIQRIALTHQN